MREKGKCYSKVNRGQRQEKDLYQTPTSMLKQFLDTEYFNPMETVLEPCAGKNAIVKVLIDRGFKVFASDISLGSDFLKTNYCKYTQIITNPPYSQAHEFVKRAKEICTKKFAFLLKLDFLSGQKRFEEIYQDICFPLTKVYVFTRMPMLTAEIREDGKYKTGTQTYAWFVWEKREGNSACYPAVKPVVDWIDCKDYILKKRDL